MILMLIVIRIKFLWRSITTGTVKVPTTLNIVVFLFMSTFYVVVITNEVLQAKTNLYCLSSMLHARRSFVESKHVARCQIVVSVCYDSFIFKSRIILPLYFRLHFVVRYWIIVAPIKGPLSTNSVGPLDDGRRREPKNPDFNLSLLNRASSW